MIACWVRGLSDRDVEAMLVEVFGQDAGISRSTCSRIGQRLRAEFDTWNRRALSGTRIDYLDLDGSFFKLHPRPGPNRCWSPGDRHRRQAGIPRPGPGRGRVDRRLAGVLADLIDRGWAARCWSSPTAARPGRGDRVQLPGQPGPALCGPGLPQPHRQGPHHAQDQVKRDSWAVLDDIEHDGQAAVAEARRRAKRFIAKWRPLYPTAVAWVADHLEALVVHLLFPAEHHKRIRHSNLIERTFGETRRRVKVIGRLPGEQSCLSLVWAVLDRASKGWRGLTMTPQGAAPAAGPTARAARPATTNNPRGGGRRTVTAAA